MMVLGLILCAQALLAGRRVGAGETAHGGAAEPVEGDSDAEGAGIGGLVRAGGMLAIGIVYLLIVRTLGYAPAIALLIAAAALYGGAALSWRLFAIAVTGAVLYWLVFVWLLGIPLPGGVLADIF
jgi:hypothetical protein